MNVTNGPKHRQSNHTPVHGASLILIAAGLFSAMGLGIRLGRDHFRADNLVFYRSLIQMMLLLPWIKRYFRPDTQQFTRLRFHLFRGLFGILSMVAVYSSLQRLPLAFATLLSMTGVMWAVFFARIFLQEKLTRRQIVAALITSLGLLLVVAPSRSHNLWASDWPGIALGLVGGIMMGAAHTLIRKMRVSNTETREIVFFFGVSGCLLTLPGFLSHPQIPVTGAHWQTICLVGLIGSLGQIFMTAGFRYTTTTVGSLCILQQTPLNVLVGLWVLGETPPPLFFAGLALTFLGLAGIVYTVQGQSQSTS